MTREEFAQLCREFTTAEMVPVIRYLREVGEEAAEVDEARRRAQERKDARGGRP